MDPNPPVKMDNTPKFVVAGILVCVVVLVAIAVLLKQNLIGNKPAATITQTNPTPTPSSQITQPASTSSASKASSNSVPIAERHYFTFTSGTVVDFNSATNILTLSTKEKPAWKITMDSSIKLYKDKGMANLVIITPSELVKGQSVSVQQDANTKNVVQITTRI